MDSEKLLKMADRFTKSAVESDFERHMAGVVTRAIIQMDEYKTRAKDDLLSFVTILTELANEIERQHPYFPRSLVAEHSDEYDEMQARIGVVVQSKDVMVKQIEDAVESVKTYVGALAGSGGE